MLRRRLLPLLVLVFTGLLGLVAGPATERASSKGRRLESRDAVDRYLVRRIVGVRAETWRWQTLIGVRPSPSAFRPRRHRDHAYRRWILHRWHRRAVHLRQRALNPPHLSEWLCIHRYEGAWNAATGNGYYGGLQMDMSFQANYARWLLRRKGTANNWTPVEQMWVAERAHRSGLGFSPWPNTAHSCGLL